MNDWISLLKSELLKHKRSWGLLLILLFPLLFTLINTIDVLHKVSEMDDYSYNPWTFLLSYRLFLMYSFFYPLVISLFVYNIIHIERVNLNYIRLYLLPVSPCAVFLSKIVFAISVLLASVLMSYILFLLSGYWFSIHFSYLHFSDYEYGTLVGSYFVKLFLVSTSILMVQYLITNICRNLMLSIGFACIGVVFSFVFAQWEYMVYIPYYFPYSLMNDYMLGDDCLVNATVVYSVLYSVLSLGFSWIHTLHLKC